MDANSKSSNSSGFLVYITLIFSFLALTSVSVYAIYSNKANTFQVFNIILPVFATWVGAILAFYFARENFESANMRVLELVKRISQNQRENNDMDTVMRPRNNITCFQIPRGKSEKNVTLFELKARLKGEATRLPVLDGNGVAIYMIHESRIDKYLSSATGRETATLDQFISDQVKTGVDFRSNSGFIIVAEDTGLKTAKRKLEQTSDCQDIFITKNGSDKEPLTGWVSNVRLARSIQL